MQILDYAILKRVSRGERGCIFVMMTFKWKPKRRRGGYREIWDCLIKCLYMEREEGWQRRGGDYRILNIGE